MKRCIAFLMSLFLSAVVAVPLSSAADEPAMVVGRIFQIRGDLLRYVPETKDWVAVVKDAPFGTGDALFSGNRGMAELIAPNGAWVRIGGSTQIQFINLDTDLSEMDLASGVGRFYNKSSDTIIKVTSPFGYVLAYSGAVFDFYAGDNSVEVIALKGKVSFVHSTTEARYEVAAGSPSILADEQQVSSGEGTVDPGWDRWNTARENFWAAKARIRGRSAEFVPPTLRHEAYALDENGRWERVYYGGGEYWLWRPTTIGPGWSPFTVGRWTYWYGDQTWIPAEPFGYVTHHYGNWVYVGGYWYWAPPVVRVRVGLPLLDVGYYWYPGRVCWIHTGIYMGWAPLAPRETYYCYHSWGGPHTVVVNNVNITQINVNIRNYTYINQAVVVHQNNFYNVNNYRNVQVTNINRTTIINNYHAAPVVNNTVIKNYNTIQQRYNYTNVAVKEKPHNTVVSRIRQNETLIHRGRKEKAFALQEQVKNIPQGKVNREARIEQPKITNYIVPSSEVNRPKSEMKLQRRVIKSRAEGAAGAVPGASTKPESYPRKAVQQEKPGKPEQPSPGSERVRPAKPVPPRQPAVGPEPVAPAKPSQQEKAGQVRPVQPGQPVTGPERVGPVKPGQQEKPSQIRPVQPGQPVTGPERVGPVKPSQQEKPGQVRPIQPGQPVTGPERVAPAKPGREEQHGPPEAERAKPQRRPPEQSQDQPRQEEKPR